MSEHVIERVSAGAGRLFLEVTGREQRRAVRRLGTTGQRANRDGGGVVDVSRPTEGNRTFLQSLRSWLGAAGLALLVPFAILLIGLPIALAVRLLLEVSAWILAAIF